MHGGVHEALDYSKGLMYQIKMRERFSAQMNPPISFFLKQCMKQSTTIHTHLNFAMQFPYQKCMKNAYNGGKCA